MIKHTDFIVKMHMQKSSGIQHIMRLYEVQLTDSMHVQSADLVGP